MAFAAQATDTRERTGAAAPTSVRYRLRFKKGGDLRLVSHHDLMKVFERMVRRADLPILQTQGFNPHAKMTFALSLALGVIGAEEIIDLDIAAGLSVDEVKERLIRQAPPGLEILDLKQVDRKSKLHVRRVWYRCVASNPDLPQRIADFLAAPASWVDRLKPQPRRLNVRPYVNVLRLSDNHLEMALWITPYGAARPEEVLRFLGLAEAYENGDLILERTRLELEEEVPPDAGLMPEALQNATNQREPCVTKHDTGQSGTQERKTASPVAAESAARATPLISNPLEFDS
jgi:radical SAM-linked protein